ncbi:AAA family ATPase [Flavobacterium panici]|nr:AAA family ATPase [Flavobacterium panici]
MRYKKFIIDGYRGISEITEINISKESLIPIIGKNESGKTTCLEAILAFDYNNDNQYSGKHLENIENLYSTIELPIKISAEIEFEHFSIIEDVFQSELESFKSSYVPFVGGDFVLSEVDFELNKFSGWESVQMLQILNEKQNENCLLIQRDLRTKKYSIEFLNSLIDVEANNSICEKIVRELPYTLYFDDFRDRLPEKIFITSDENHSSYSGWLPYIDEIFKVTKKDYSVYLLPNKNSSLRKSILKEVQNAFNKKLLEEWSKYQFEHNDNIHVEIDYVESGDLPYLEFKIVEKVLIDGNWEERFFDISDRSKGFYWYINFMIKLHYNSEKRDLNDKDTVYLLDEPGSYLHTYALNKLAEQLKNISVDNKVIYCTHSHNLLNPEFIPINSIRLAEKKEGKISLKKLDHKGIIRPQKNSAYQSIFDALEVRPPLLDFQYENIILVEGIYDYYAFTMFTGDKLSYFPCVSASSMINQIPYMIFLGKKYLALWDNDNEGRERLKKAIETFGEIEGKKFLILESIDNKKNTRLEEYFNENEMFSYSGLKNLTKPAFCKFVLDLYYKNDRASIIEKAFPLTKKNFKMMEQKLVTRLE